MVLVNQTNTCSMKNTLVLLVLFAIVSLTNAQTCEIGLDNITVQQGDATNQTWATGTGSQIHGVQRTANKSGLITQIGVITGSEAANIKVALYSDNNNNVQNLLSTAPELNPPGSPDVLDTFYVTLNTPVAISYGQKVWPCMNFQTHTIPNVLNNGMNNEPGFLKFKIGNPYANSWPATLNPTETTGQYALFLVIEDCVEPTSGCMDNTACNYDPLAVIDDSSCTFPDQYYDCSNNCLNDTDSDGVCDEEEVLGCMDSGSCNYNPLATEDFGCIYLSNPYYNCAGVCNNDADGDGVCDEEEVPGCMDHTAVNYSPAATDPILLGVPGACFWQAGCAGCDFDQSNLVDVEDIIEMVTDFGGYFPYGKSTDITQDGEVSMADLLNFLQCFGVTP
jgi:hypothetical protein